MTMLDFRLSSGLMSCLNCLVSGYLPFYTWSVCGGGFFTSLYLSPACLLYLTGLSPLPRLAWVQFYHIRFVIYHGMDHTARITCIHGIARMSFIGTLCKYEHKWPFALIQWSLNKWVTKILVDPVRNSRLNCVLFLLHKQSKQLTPIPWTIEHLPLMVCSLGEGWEFCSSGKSGQPYQ